MKPLDRKLLAVFKPGEILTLHDVAARSRYGDSTVMCRLPDMVKRKLLWRVARGQYSLDPTPPPPSPAQAAILEVMGRVNFCRAAWLREQTGLAQPEFRAAIVQLLQKGTIRDMRQGVYTLRKGVKRPLNTPEVDPFA